MAGFCQMEEAQRILVVPWELVERAVEDSFREEWAEEPGIMVLMEDSVVVVVLMEDMEVAAVVVAGTLVEAVEIIILDPVGVGEDLITPEEISIMDAVTKQLAMVL